VFTPPPLAGGFFFLRPAPVGPMSVLSSTKLPDASARNGAF
jgi:hypothetical protein